MRQPFDTMVAGAVVDLPPWDLPPNVWSDSRNVRFRDGATEIYTGQKQVFGTTIGSPRRLLPISTGGNYFWVYGGPQNIYATDGVGHGDITPAGGLSLDSTNVPGWTGGAFQGFMVMVNGIDDPVSWSPNLGSPAIPLVNWPTDLQCRIIRPFRNYLFALGCTESGQFNPRLLRWGKSASPNSLPTSWDYTDPTNDSGRIDFGQTSDRLVDLLPLRDNGVLYKENSTWAIQYIGGIDNPFLFRQVFSQIGMLTAWCGAAWQGKHIVLSTNDLVIHDLNSAESIIDGRYRRWLFNQIDSTNFRQSFVVPNYREREIWCCIPEAGHDFANIALVWNYKDGTVQVRELGFDTPHIAYGIVNDAAVGSTFEDLIGTFDDQSGPFDSQQFNPSVTSLLMSNDTLLYMGDEGSDFAGTPISAYWERRALPLDKDILRWAHVKAIYPKVIGTIGDTLTVKIGTRKVLEDPVAFSDERIFTIGTDFRVNFAAMGRIIDVRFEHTSANPMRMHGFDVEFDQAGYF